MAALIVLAVLALLVALTVRADAQPGVGEPRAGSIGVTDDARATIDAGAASEDRDDDVLSLDGPCADCDITTLAGVATRGPSIQDVVAAAQRTAGLARTEDPTASWRRRSRWSSLVPWITVRAGNTQSWRDVEDPTLLTVHHAAAFDARLAWHLDQLVFDPDEPRITAFDLSRRRDRRRVAALASRAYFTWLRAAIATERDTRWQLRLAEAEAELDALTDGWFSQVLGARTAAPGRELRGAPSP